MDVQDFTTEASRLTEPEIRHLAAAIARRSATTAGEVAQCEAGVAIERALRHPAVRRRAAWWAHRACTAVTHAAEREGVALPDEDVTRVARTAAEIARGLVAGGSAREATGSLVEVWSGARLPSAA